LQCTKFPCNILSLGFTVYEKEIHMLHINENADTEKRACDSRVSRKEFLTTLVRRAALAGALLAAPKVVDKFLVPPAYAVTSTSAFSDTGNINDTNARSDVTNARRDSTNPGNTLRQKPNRANQPDDFG
jgi:hypothetical protein